MIDSSLQTQIDAATAYEQLFVPALFGQWPPQVIAAARIGPGLRVAGNGITFELSAHVATATKT